MPPESATTLRRYRFGAFEFSSESGELYKSGRKIRLQDKPTRALAILVERAGQLVTREALRDHLWPDGTFVEFDDNVNTTIRRVRDALGDTAESPRYVETIPRRGYRFIAPVEPIRAAQPATSAMGPPFRPNRGALIAALLCGCAVILVALDLIPGFRIPRSGPPNPPTMFAVLPFRNLSGIAAEDYLSDGVTEELITHLGSLVGPQLGVLSQSSVGGLRATTKGPREIGKELGVSYLLEGTVSRLNGYVHVTAQLVRAETGANLWSDTYDRPSSDLFSIESEVARRVAERIAIRFLPGQEAALARATTLNTDAYDSYLSGLHQQARGTRESFYSALASFERAASLDTNFALAHDGAARVYVDLAAYHFMPADEAYREARRHLEIALKLDGEIPGSRELDAVLIQRANPGAPGIDQAYQAAIGLNPSDARSHRDYALYLLSRGRSEAAIAEIAKAIRLDPLSPGIVADHAWVLFVAKRYNEAQAAARRALALDPNFPYSLYVFGLIQMHSGHDDDAVETYRRAVESSGRTPKYLYALADVYIRTSHESAARPLFDELSAQAKTEYVPPEYLRDLGSRLNR
jgi:TolB-like protein/DNA-binding winged helix-turn-helix (wHTH) protein/Tfp pilus assembly protein PilF